MPRPHNWVVIKMDGDEPHYRVLAGWSGGYLEGNYWQINSGITRVEDDNNYYDFYGVSGSCYSCYKESYGLRQNNINVWSGLQRIHGHKVKMMDEETHWMSMDWIIK